MSWLNLFRKNKESKDLFTPDIKNIGIIWSVKVINNTTDQEIIFESTNQFGLDLIKNKDFVSLRQNQDINNNTVWRSIGFFTNWSVSEIEWKTVQVKVLKDDSYELIEE